MSEKKRVCVIGAGPSGMSVLFHFDKAKKEGKKIPEVICYERQANVGGLWNYTWRTGTDEYGDTVHCSMYRNMWSNNPKEAYEYHDYSFNEHFGKPIPSFAPREVVFDYLKGRFAKADTKAWIRLFHKVHDVQYNEASDDFTVVVKNQAKDTLLPAEQFDYVIVASGHFSVPNVPSFPGIEQFPGRVLHSHDFRNAEEFKGERVLMIGSSYSAEDIALQCIKYGAKSVVLGRRSKATEYKWPPQISQKPAVTRIDGKIIHFQDGCQVEVDAIILSTGYHHYYPFLSDNLRLKTENVLYPDGLYRNTIWTKAGKNKLMYIGAQNQVYTFPMFDAQGKWAVDYIMGDIKLPSKEIMEDDTKKWVLREKTLTGFDDAADFQSDFLVELANEANYGHDLDCRDFCHTWERNRLASFMTYREQSYTSKVTGSKSPLYHTTFMEAMDDSMERFLNTKY